MEDRLAICPQRLSEAMSPRLGSPRHSLTNRKLSTTPRIWRTLASFCLVGGLYAIFHHRYALRHHLRSLHHGTLFSSGSPYAHAQQRLADRYSEAQWAVGLDASQEAIAGAWKPGRRDPDWVSPSPYRLDREVIANVSKEVDEVDFCRPHAIWPGRPPTVVLRPYSLDATIGHSLDTSKRTHHIGKPFAVSPDSAPPPNPKAKAKEDDGKVEDDPSAHHDAEISPIGFLPWAPYGIYSKDDHSDEPVPRFRDSAATSYVNFHNLDDPLKNRIPPPPPSLSPSASDSPDDPKGSTARAKADPVGYRYRTAPCLSYDVPASEDIIPKAMPPRFMFGMATTPQRILRVLPVWEDWHSSSPIATLPSYTVAPSPPRFLVLSPPRTASGEPTDAIEWDRARDKLYNSTIPLTLRSLAAPRNEQRYFSLVREMWKDEQERAEAFAKNRTKASAEVKRKGVKQIVVEEEKDHDAVDWFVLADDDTYFLSLGELGRMVAKYDPEEPRIVGSHSENPVQIVDRIAFGGAGILLSRGMMKLLNKPNFFDMCFSKFGHLGGAFSVLWMARYWEPTDYFRRWHRVILRGVGNAKTAQEGLDDRADPASIRYRRRRSRRASSSSLPTRPPSDPLLSMQFFQAGLRIASLHHWNSWYSLFPPHHTTALHDDYQAVRLLGRAARGVGVSNWGRRYVWGLADDAASGDESVVTLSLGYALTIWAPGELDHASLYQIVRLHQAFSSARVADIYTLAGAHLWRLDHTGFETADQRRSAQTELLPHRLPIPPRQAGDRHPSTQQRGRRADRRRLGRPQDGAGAAVRDDTATDEGADGGGYGERKGRGRVPQSSLC